MAFIRFVGLVLVALGLMWLGADIVSTLEMKALVLRSLDHNLALVSLSPKTWVEAKGAVWWANVLGGLLAAPSWILPMLFAGFLVLVSRRRKERPEPSPPPEEP